MGFPIPKLQYKNVDAIGSTTLSDGSLTGLGDTSKIQVGMFARGAGIPVGSTVGTVTAVSVTLANGVVCTVTSDFVALSFGYEIIFDYPPEEQNGAQLEQKNTTSQSLSGIQQVAINYIEETRALSFAFLTPTLYAQLDTFLRTSAILSEIFRYFDDQTLTTYIEYELSVIKVLPQKINGHGANAFVWRVPLTFRRAL